MGRPVVHFEVMGKEAERLQSFYSQLFDWRIHADNEMGYGLVAREGNTKAEGAAIGGGVGAGPDARAEELGGARIFGPDQPPGLDLTLGQFSDPEWHVIGLVQPG
jgi:predicted enzyme related to lactoylglutathione lyase